MNTFLLNVTACDRVFFEGYCRQVILPLEDGEKGIQAHHENMVFAVNVGELRIQTDDGAWITGVVGSGFAQVINNRVSVLVDTAEHPDEIDVRRAKEAKERAKEQLRQEQSIRECQDFAIAVKMICGFDQISIRQRKQLRGDFRK